MSIPAFAEINKEELMELTGTKTLGKAVETACKFTLMHDKDSVQEALKS